MRTLIATTTVTNDDRYLSNLDLVKKAWNNCGYYLHVLFVDSEDKAQFGHIQFNDKLSDLNNRILLPKMNHDKFVSVVQSLRFYSASRLLSNSDVLITDADIMPLNKEYFSIRPSDNEVLNLNNTLYSVFNNDNSLFDHDQLPACYYFASSNTWSKIMPDTNDPIKWIKEYLPKYEIGRDEYYAYERARSLIRKDGPTIKIGGPNSQRISIPNCKKLSESINYIDFHLPHLVREDIINISNKYSRY